MDYFKKLLASKSNIVTLFVLIFVLYRQIPVWLKNRDWQGQQLEPQSYQPLNEPKQPAVLFPAADSRSMAIFWASWCGPCKIEMNRLKNSVETGKIKKQQIFAINPFENEYQIKRFLKKNDYPFTFITAPVVNERIQVNLTPTTILLEGTKVENITSGISFVGIWRAEIFLRE